ncbi:hypothetical protein DBT_2223 [Dissulfuribacter thermophilus]|uniref:Glycosyltransferase n=2 Tax=Dissulfuribacter thermophilus TaxID=1156395 RepID=A0A1B9F353_9BACT|nr:hypothetical protein DBT_2223 [Dissulfuribacter thermophilus]
MDLFYYSKRPIIGAYYYTGWHPLKEREKHLGPNWTEWELVLNAPPRFDGHDQPKIPLLGPYDDRRPETLRLQQSLARSFGIDFFCFGAFWSRGERFFEAPLDDAFLKNGGAEGFPFCVMWANRLPRKVLPVKIRPKEVIEESRRVTTDIDDFLNLIKTFEKLYFRRRNYVKFKGAPLFLIFDSTFFLRELGIDSARTAILEAKRYLAACGYEGGLYIIAVNPVLNSSKGQPDFMALYKEAGFDAITHYVFLPHWKGPYVQDYEELMIERSSQWQLFRERSNMPYFPSVATGWDATPRGAIFEKKRPKRYPWWPIVLGNSPELFSKYLVKALKFSLKENPIGLSFVASMNEWSEGHYLEPCSRFGFGWLRGVLEAKQRIEGVHTSLNRS